MSPALVKKKKKKTLKNIFQGNDDINLKQRENSYFFLNKGIPRKKCTVF